LEINKRKKQKKTPFYYLLKSEHWLTSKATYILSLSRGEEEEEEEEEDE
jgi:hypothetical protein